MVTVSLTFIVGSSYIFVLSGVRCCAVILAHPRQAFLDRSLTKVQDIRIWRPPNNNHCDIRDQAGLSLR